MANPPEDSPVTTDSSDERTVSVMLALFMIVVTPRAIAMISAAPMKSPAPAMIDATVPCSPRPPTKPTTTAATRNRAASSGKYQPSVMPSSDLLKSDHGITANTMSTNVRPKIASTIF